MTQLIVGGALFLLTLVLVMIRPFGISEAIVAGIGGGLMVGLGIVQPSDAVGVLLGEWNVFGFFLGLMLISAIADRAGFFDALALYAGRAATRGDCTWPCLRSAR